MSLEHYELTSDGKVVYVLKGRPGLSNVQVREQARINISAAPQSFKTLNQKIRIWDAKIDRKGVRHAAKARS